MKRCVTCGKNSLNSRLLPYSIDIGTRTFESDIKAWRCEACAECFFDGRAIEKVERSVAKWLIEQGYDGASELRFLRKVAGIRALDLASLLGVSAETVSHWETGKHAIDVATRNAVASLALDALRGATTTREQLRALRAPARTKKVRLGAGKAA